MNYAHRFDTATSLKEGSALVAGSSGVGLGKRAELYLPNGN
jgi:hypothetical protein